MPAATLRFALVLGLLGGAPLTGQQWLFGLDITARDGPGLAYDAARWRTVLFGGTTTAGPSDETWLFDGTDWHKAQPPNRPPPRSRPAMAYDVSRDRVVLFGGVLANNVKANDTWEFDGTDWTQVFPSRVPSPRTTAMAYDLGQGRVVMFGGEGAALLDDTWVFDGTDWTQINPSTRPWARRWHALAYDAVRARTVMFGGEGSAQTDTWEFDGADWTRVTTPTAPSSRRHHGMAYDVAQARIVLFGGISFNSILRPNLADTWEYDGVGWTEVTPPSSPTPQWHTGLAYDFWRRRTVLFGSGNGADPRQQAETWTWDGATWTHRSVPSSRDQPALAHDTLRGRTVMFGGANSAVLQDTWEHDGTRWRRTATAASPRRAGAAMAFDPQRARMVLFGGAFLWATYDDTWEYDGATWTQGNPSIRPPPRTNHAMAYDAARRRIVLFGGETGASNRTYYNDTWEFDGATWRQITPASILPAARSLTAMVFDSARNRILLFGGTNNPSYAGFSDTWVYDGSTWRQLAPTTVPPARHGHGLAYDAIRGRTLLFGGSLGSLSRLADTWEFDGDDWSPVTTPATPVPHSCHLVYQQDTGRVLSFGGLDANRQPVGGTMLFVPAPTPTFTRHGSGCPGSAGTPVLDTTPATVPALGTTFPIRLTGLPSAPGIALLAFGFDLVRWNAAVLPLELAAFGLPGCDLWIGPTDGMSVLVSYAGSATYPLALPATPALAGVVAGVQALVFDSGASSGLGAVTNAAILRLH